MRGHWQILVFMGGLLAVAAPLFAVFDPTPDELQHNRQRLRKWIKADRQNGNHKNYVRLCRELRDFLALPAKRQEQLRRLDHDLLQQEPEIQARLLNVLERYAVWLERLPRQERTDIQKMPNGPERLYLVRHYKEKQWIARLPAAERAQLAKVRGSERKQLLKDLKQKDRQRRREWAKAFKRWDALLAARPFKLENSPPEVRTFYNEYLLPRLNEQDKKRLEWAADKPILFPIMLINLADRHPMALPGSQGPTRFEDLPEKVQELLPELKDQKDIEGQWPDYGKKVAAKLRSKKQKNKGKVRLPVEFMPSAIEDLSPVMKRFIRQKLRPQLNQKERARLRNAKGWPAFPHTINELSRKHDLRVPWQTLPGPQERWDIYRAKPLVPRKALPDVPRKTLRNFALLELSAQERERLGLSATDARSWERLQKIYFKRHPEKLKRWREMSKKKKKGNKVAKETKKAGDHP
jgi:hypothetical protein